MLNGKRILVAPLDWGLGHGARCVPIIRRLVDRGAIPVIGADRGPLALLRAEFPGLEHVRLPGAGIRYAHGTDQLWSMARQFPRLLHSIRQEHRLFERIRHDLRFDAVISDQRFGVRTSDLPSVLITHQVFPRVPFTQGALRYLNLRMIARFHRCWIMDEPDAPGWAGALSHGQPLPRNARYIGTVSRFSRNSTTTGPTYRIVAVISGPEPHRTQLEAILTDQLQRIAGPHLLVCGLPVETRAELIGNIHRLAHLPGDQLAQALLSAELIVSRSGYTTLMDLAALGRNALLIPTPGQPEQEYLGELHAGIGGHLVQSQQRIDLAAAMAIGQALPHSGPWAGSTHLDRALDDLGAMLG